MFRFTIRDLLWLMVVAGLAMGWYLHYGRLTRPPKLYRDDEIVARHKDYIVGYYELIVPDIVPHGTSMPLAQVFKKLGIDPSRLTDFRKVQYNRSISLSWQISPSYDLTCSTLDDDEALAFDDPKRTINAANIQRRENSRESSEPPTEQGREI